MKTFYAFAMFMFFSVHTIFGDLFNGNWSVLSSPDFDYSGFMSMSGKGDYIWFKFDDGLVRYSIPTNELINFKPDFSNLDYEEATFFALDSGNTALISPRGISRFDGISWTFISTPKESAGSAIDSMGCIWTICRIDGIDESVDRVYYCKNAQWIEAPFNNRINGFIHLINADATDRIWLTDDSKVYCYNKSTDSLSTFKSDMMKYTLRDQRGHVWFYNDTSLYSTSDSGLVLKYKDNFRTNSNLLQIDSNGDLWFVSRGDYNQIVKVDLKTSQILMRFNLPDFVPTLYSNAYGVFTLSKSGFLFFKNNDTLANTISLDSMLCSSCPNIRLTDPAFSLFRKNGSHLYVVDYLLSNELLVERVGNKCTIIPLPSEKSNITSMYEKSDGTLIAGICGNECGLYSLKDHTWTLIPGTEGMRISKLFEDSKGKIWGIFEGKIIRQTQSGWELIDTSNSNLPQLIKNQGFGFAFAEDSEHAIWTAFDSSVARTFDGYNWTTYTHHGFNSYSYMNHNLLYTDQNNNVMHLWCDTMYDSIYVNRATFIGNNWHYEKIVCPMNISENPFINQDSRGVLYLKPFRGDTLFYYDTTLSNWIPFDKSKTPYNLTGFISDDYQGKIYFNSSSNQIIVFDYKNTNVMEKNKSICKQNGFKPRILTSGKLAIDFKVNKPGNLSIGVFSPDGKLVKMLFNSFHPEGTFKNSYDLKCSGGMYIIQIKTSDKSMISTTIIK